MTMDILSNSGQFYGKHETVVSEGGEGNLQFLSDTCSKNPGHKQFVSVFDLDLQHLPENYKDPDICDYIKVVADLTVRISLNSTSLDRPEFWMDTQVPYPFFDIRGRALLRTGSGMIRRVTMHAEEDPYPEGCKCASCQASGQPKKSWVELDIFTATHVVFNAQESERACVRFFYDHDDSQSVVVSGVSLVRSDMAEDLSWLKCAICDPVQAAKFCGIWEKFVAIRSQVCERYEGARDEGRMTFIVSHPHGCSKKVTIGHWKDRVPVADRLTRYTYDAATCNGSSGASVNILGYNTGRWFYRQHVHSGVMQETNTNYSSTGLD